MRQGRKACFKFGLKRKNAMATTHEERTTSDEDEIGVATETTRRDDNLRGVYEDEDTTVEIEISKDEAKNEKASLNEEIKDENLNNNVNLNNHTEMNTGIASGHTAVLRELQTRLKELGSDKDGEILALIERLNEEHQKEIETVQKSSDKFFKEDGQHESEEMSKTLAQNEAQFLKSKHKEEMEELRRTLDDEYQKQVLKISDELRDHYQNDINEKITKLEEEWELEFIKQKREFDERVTAVQKEQWSQCHDAIERVTLDAEDQLKNMKHAYDSETAEQKRRIQELLEERALFEMKEKELDEEKCQKENESFEKIKTLEKQLSNEREEVEYQINGAQNEIQKIKNEHRKEIENLKTELEKKYSNILNETRNEMKEKYQKELDEKVQRVKSHLQEQYEEHLEKTKEELRESSRTLKTKYEKQLSEVVSQLEELHERNQEHELQEAKLKKDYETEKKKVEELEKDVEKKWEDIQQLAEKTKDHDLETETHLNDNQDETLRQVLKEKKSLQVQLDEVSSRLLIIKEKDKENEKTDVLKIQSHKEEMAKLKAELELGKASEEEILQIKNELKASKENASRLQRELVEEKASGEEISSLKNEMELRKASEEEISNLKNELELRKASEEEISNLKKELELRKPSEEEISSLKNELELRKASEEEISNLKNELELRKASEEEISSLKNELELRKASEEEISSLKKELELRKASEEEISSLKNELELRKASEEEISSLKNELELRKASEEEISSLKNELELRKASEEEISSLKNELELRKASEEEISSLKNELELRKASEEEISSLKNELELRKASEEEISSLKNELELRKASEEEISSLKNELELRKASEEEISSLKNELELRKASEEEISSLKNELELRKASEEEISSFKNELELRKASEEEISSLKKELELRKASEEEISNLKNELELRKASEEEISSLKNELELRKASEEEISSLKKELELRKASEEEISNLKNELELRKATINELEELSRAHELEIANLILHSPVTSDEVDKEFEFSGKPEDKIEQLEIEIVNYKKKIMELEEEAEDKFETTLCENCEDGETREQIITKAKVLMEKIENDCMEKVEDLTKKLEKSEEMFKKQTTLIKGLEEKLSKVETELKKEMNRSMELSKLNKHLDINHNVLQVVNTETQTLDEKLVGEKDISKKDSDISKKDSEISEKNSEISEKDSEISEKDSEISKITNENEQMRALVETLKKKLRQGEKKYEQLTIRAMDQKSNYESEIQLMQKEIEALIQENKDQENKQKISETILQEKMEELETVMDESSSKHREKVARLNEIIQEKEHCLEDLKKKQHAVETSRKEINTNIENLKKEFEAKERELLNEMREKSASFEHERNEVLENSFQEKEELQTRINDLEKQCKDSNIWLKSDEESEISYSTSNEKRHRTEAREISLSNQDRLAPSQGLSMERPSCSADQERSLKSMKEHDWINRDNREITRDEYQEHISSLLEDHPRYDGILEDKREYNGILGDKEGYEGIMEDKMGYGRNWEDKREYEGILEDKMGYTGITDGGREESLEYDIYRYEERELENEKYQMEIELLVEKGEKERLKQELGTMTTCVDVFHDECQHLKTSLDKALNMIKIIKQERDDLVQQSHQSLDEHSEIMLELIKYEEIIKKLEMGNEKLEKEKEMLEQYLVQNGDKITASEHEYSTKSNPEIQRTFLPKNDEVRYSRIARNNEYFTKPNREIQTPFLAKNDKVKDLGDTKIKAEIQEIDFLMEELEKELETREGPSNDDEDHLATLAGYKNKLQEKPVKTSMLNTLSFASEKDWEQVERTNDQRRNERERKNDSSFLQTRLSGYQSYEDKTNQLSRKHGHNQRVTAQQRLPQELKYTALSRRENDFLLEDQPGPESDNYMPMFPWKHQDSITSRKHVTFTRDEHSRTPEHNKDVMQASSGSIVVDRNQFPSKSTHVKRQLSTETFNREKYREKNVEKKNFVKKNGQKSSEKSQIGEANKLCRSSSRDSSRIVRKITTTPFTSISQDSENASTISSSFLTSTKTNSALRLVPNLSGLSPIVSELERRRHEEMLKWQVADHLPRDPSFDDVETTILTTADPFGYQQARTPPNFERSSYGNSASFAQKTKQKSWKRSEKHVRSRSADDRLFRSPSKVPSFNILDDSYTEKPLTINFEDYVIRHRVKSSEDVANLRDPSPAELWLY